MYLELRNTTYYCRCGRQMTIKPSKVSDTKKLRRAGWAVIGEKIICRYCIESQEARIAALEARLSDSVELRQNISRALIAKIRQYPSLETFLQRGAFEAHPQMLIDELTDCVTEAIR